MTAKPHLLPVAGLTGLFLGLLFGSIIGYAVGSKSAAVPSGQGQVAVAPQSAPDKRPEAPPLPKGPVLQVTAKDLFAAHVIDLAKATATYQGKVLEIALPGEIQVDSAGRRFLASDPQRLVKGDPMTPRSMHASDFRSMIQNANLNARYLPGIWAFIRDRTAVSGTGPGKPCTVRGRYQGTIQDNTTSPEFVIILEDCERVRP